MRQLHRVHRVDIHWSHGRLGNHTMRDPTILAYEHIENMREI